MGEQESIVRRFLDVWTEPDLERLIAGLAPFVAEDAVMHQMPFAEVRGHAGLRRICEESLATMTESEIDVVAITSAGNTVFAERVDRFVLRGKHVAVPVLGVFELSDDGQIVAWRDYFDSKPLFFDARPLFQPPAP